jgi:hypothetical protein
MAHFVGDCLKRISEGFKQLNADPYFDDAAGTAAKAKTLYKLNTDNAATIWQKLDSYLRNSYLSAIPTHVTNVLSNLTKVITEPFVTFGTSLTSKDVRMVDALHEVQGMAKGFIQAAPRFWNNLTETIAQGGLGNIAEDTARASWHSSKVSDIRLVNQIATFPIALTKALDEGTKAVLDSMGVEVARSKLLRDPRVQAFAKKSNLSGDALNKEATKFLIGDASAFDQLAKVTDIGKIPKEIKMWSDYNTYNNPLGNSSIDKIAKAVEGMREKLPVIGTLLVPFIKVPLNVAKEGASYVPGIGLFRIPNAIAEAKRAGELATSIKGKLLDAKREYSSISKVGADWEQEAALAKIEKLQGDLNKTLAYQQYQKEMPARFRAQQAIGMGLMAYTYSLANSGNLTGHFNDPGERARMQAAGIPPMSVKIGDNWHSYEKIEPFATIMGTMADWSAHEKAMKREGKSLMDIETAKKVPQILADNIFNKTFTESLFKVSQAIAQPERYASNLAGILNPVVPSAVAQAAQILDPTKRETKEGLMSPVNALQARIPGLREKLPAKIDILGEPIKQFSTTAEGITGKNPFVAVPAAQTGVQQMVANPYLQVKDMVTKIHGVELEPKDIEMLKRDGGKQALSILKTLENDPSFKAQNRPMQAAIVKKVFSNMRNAARADRMAVMMSDPVTANKVIENMMKAKGLQEDTGE